MTRYWRPANYLFIYLELSANLHNNDDHYSSKMCQFAS